MKPKYWHHKRKKDEIKKSAGEDLIDDITIDDKKYSGASEKPPEQPVSNKKYESSSYSENGLRKDMHLGRRNSY